jgi:hypothetical protein
MAFKIKSLRTKKINQVGILFPFWLLLPHGILVSANVRIQSKFSPGSVKRY